MLYTSTLSDSSVLVACSKPEGQKALNRTIGITPANSAGNRQRAVYANGPLGPDVRGKQWSARDDRGDIIES